MIAIAVALFAAQAVAVPDASAWTVDRRIAYLAESESRVATRIERRLYADPAIRAELRRVGFATGCSAFGRSSRKVVSGHVPALKPHFEAAIRRLVPAEQIVSARFLSFLAHPLMLYQRRVVDAAERSAETELAAAAADLRAAFLSETKQLRTNEDPSANVVMPRADIGRALGVAGAWNLDDPNHVAMACIEQLISPGQRPLISGGGPVADRQRSN